MSNGKKRIVEPEVPNKFPHEHGTSIISGVCAISMYITLLAYTLVILIGERFLLPPNEADWCRSAQLGYPNVKTYDNPDYNNNPCFKERPWQLLFMCQMECDFARRMISSSLMGAAIGFERKARDRPAGIRTMSLVSLGSCFFTMCGQMAFRSSTMGWDAARVSAAIPSGVGFLGAGLIWKGTVGPKGTPDERHEVHGLTTAASVWLSASVGVGAGGRLYIVSVYAVALVILVLRMGPTMYFAEDSESYMEYDETLSESEHSLSSSSDQQFSSGVDASDTGAEGTDDGVVGISREEQRRLLMSEPGGLVRDDSKLSIATCMSRFLSAPDLRSMGGGEDDKVTTPRVAAYEHSNSAPVAEYDDPTKDRPGSATLKRHRQRRRRHRSYSPRGRRFQGPSFHN